MTRTRLWVLLPLMLTIVMSAACASTTHSNATTALVVHASKTRDSILSLPHGGQLLIPAGAMTDGATVTAAYTTAPSAPQPDVAPDGPQIQVSVHPANVIHHPLELRLPLPAGANPEAARFGYYGIGYFDSTLHQWIEVETSYAPASQALLASITQLNVWSVLKQAGSDGAVATCLPRSIAPSSSGDELATKFIACIQRAGSTPTGTANKGGAALVTSSALSPHMVGDNGIVSRASAGGGITRVVGKVVLGLISNECADSLLREGLLTWQDNEDYLEMPYLEWVTPAATLSSVAGNLFLDPSCHSDSPAPVAAPPVITTVSPPSGPVAGQNTVTIEVADHSSLLGADSVYFGSDLAYLSFNVSSLSNPNVISVIAPPHAAGTVDVQVRAITGVSSKGPADQYTYVAATPPVPQTDPAPALPASSYAGEIVQWNGDTNPQKAAWLVSPDLKRYWIPDGSTYNCLVSRGFTFAGPLSSTVLDQLPDQTGQWAACGGSTLGFNQFLFRGSSLVSSNGEYHLELQRSDGNLVLYGPGGALWATGTAADFLVLQSSDSNLVTYNYGSGAVWAANTSGSGATTLVVQNDGNLVLYNSSGVAIWDRSSGRLQ